MYKLKIQVKYLSLIIITFFNIHKEKENKFTCLKISDLKTILVSNQNFIFLIFCILGEAEAFETSLKSFKTVCVINCFKIKIMGNSLLLKNGF